MALESIPRWPIKTDIVLFISKTLLVVLVDLIIVPPPLSPVSGKRPFAPTILTFFTVELTCKAADTL